MSAARPTLAPMTAAKVFMGVFSAIGTGLALLFGAWGLALIATNGWGGPAATILGIAAGFAVVTCVVVALVWRLTSR